jgi:glutamate carboxypeptidase
MRNQNQVRALHRYLRGRESALLGLLRTFVELESPSDHRAALQRFARVLARAWRRRGARVRVLRPASGGPIVRAELTPAPKPRGQILVLGHFDTVYRLGTLGRMPFRVRGGRAYGPGTVDMKSGLVQALFAVDALRALKLRPPARLVFLWTSDEEVGSRGGRPMVEREARRSRAALVLEPSTGLHGALKTARKGVGEFELVVEGRAAHAGLEPEKGVNAIEELARQIVGLKRLERPARGLTLNADVIEGGTRTNIIAERACARVDVRIARRADGRWVERQLHRQRPVDPRARLVVRGGINRPPLERTAGVRRLFRQAQALAREMGVRLEESAVGGGSDGNFTAALGVPTLDGLGGVGGGPHSPGEFIVVRRLPERTALLAGLLLSL